ncbi:Predicted dehydrogenase [Faunimonas pinastri]|uniref:Predicted dehydrogenase n=1 Tax=Faunimonas pinastri TaxID=1855383 RepID=A0A1H9AM32_9HYPH|nr:Gfo/Idh/MocA family oxidoreductase [Faunimonas pinastri]SEP77796.1 Predicted dehydrogenase [Faunimonas pinastri]
MPAREITGSKVRYAVVAGGWISQAAFMPGVEHTGNSEMTALVTGDPVKARELAPKYGIEHTYGYDQYDEMLRSGEVDAIYLALPNDQHRDFAVRALEAGIHVLLEKPMAVSEQECREIIAASEKSGARLMIAYRLHFEPATLAALELLRSGKIGDLRIFSAVFCQHVAASNHRASHGYWAGPVTDMGPYPINAARNVFRAEPTEVFAVGTRRPDLPFNFDDTVSVTMRFPDDRLAQFTVSYGANEVGQYRVVGTKGDLEVTPGFTFGAPIGHKLTVGDEKSEKKFDPTDQFGGELKYFSDCVINNRDPEPGGEEGLADVVIMEAIERSLASGRPEKVTPVARSRYADQSEKQELPPIEPPDLINASAPGEG